MEPPSRSAKRGGASRRDRERMPCKEAARRQREEQVRRWVEQFDANGSGRLERHELAALLEHLHPEAGHPRQRRSTYCSRKRPRCAPTRCIFRAIATARFPPASSCLSSRATRCTSWLRPLTSGKSRAWCARDLPSIMKELGKADGSDIEGGDVDFVMDCASSLHGLDRPPTSRATTSCRDWRRGRSASSSRWLRRAVQRLGRRRWRRRWGRRQAPDDASAGGSVADLGEGGSDGATAAPAVEDLAEAAAARADEAADGGAAVGVAPGAPTAGGEPRLAF